ncbi:MAG: M48 family metallopeptidase [Selenomonadaceae bacterium]|nr:M48 family metallopeptidase [Selenomonadaceae bacterium]
MKLISKSLAKKIAALTAAVTIIPSALLIPAKAEAFDIGGAIGGMIMAGAQAKQVSSQIDYFDDKGRDEFYGQMQQEYGVNEDPELNAKVDELMANLTEGVGAVDPSIYDKPYNYFINNDTSFNAFCSLGHNISINTGLFDMINNMDEVAVVIGHEMGHGQKEHVKKGFKKSSTLSIIAAGIQGGSSIGIAICTSVLANQVQANNITKPQEREADALAFEYLVNTPYNLGATAAVWQRVIDKSGDSKSSFLGAVFTPNDHPGHVERRDTYAKTLSAYSNDVVTVADGTVSVNGQTVFTPVDDDDMSGAERSYFVAGNLARVYHNAKPSSLAASSYGNEVYIGDTLIFTASDMDESASVLADRLNAAHKAQAPAAGKKKKKK